MPLINKQLKYAASFPIQYKEIVEKYLQNAL
jgi:hypothetical protein